MIIEISPNRPSQVLCSQDQRQLLLGFLGVAEPPPNPPTPEQTAAPVEGATAPVAPPAAEDDDPETLFSALAVATERSAEKEAEVGARALSDTDADAPQKVHVSPAAEDPALSRAVLNGHFEAAVAHCMKSGRMSDALVLAASGGPDLWTATRDKYLEISASPFSRTLQSIVHQVYLLYLLT